jgi:hypothetical protein
MTKERAMRAGEIGRPGQLVRKKAVEVCATSAYGNHPGDFICSCATCDESP